MAQFVKLDSNHLSEIRTVDERLMSYNIEFAEITGGTFWKAYTEGQIAGTEEFPPIANMQNHTAMEGLMQVYPPINLYDEKLRALARALGPVWVRVSGTWATKTYYDFEGVTGGTAPEGFMNVLTKEQWMGVLDFVRAVGAKLMVSVSNCEGIHAAHDPWKPDQAEKLFAFSREYGVPIEAAEFMNEPNIMEGSGAPAGYTPADYARDQDIFFAWVRNNYPETLLVGPCTTGNITMGPDTETKGGGIADVLGCCTTEALMEGTKEPLDAYSYHYYNGISERLASVMPGAHWPAEQAHTEAYLAMASNLAAGYARERDRFCPGGQMWVTESGDAGGGGDTWASTYLDVLRTLNELGSFAVITDGIIFHNTLASSDYGFLQHGTFEPRPNYFAVLLWNRLMGTTVYDAGIPVSEGAHIFAHSRRDGKEGAAYLVINNSLTDATTVELPADAQIYMLSAETLRSPVMLLNGRPLVLKEDHTLPDLEPVGAPAGRFEIAPGACAFLLF